MIRPEEKFAGDAFVRCLAGVGIQASWEPGEDPPDLVVTTPRKLYPVEVRFVVAMASISGDRRTELAWSGAIRTWVRRFEADARAAGLLDGLYALMLCPIPDFSGAEATLQRGIRDYMAETRGHARGDIRTVWADGAGHWWMIQKVAASPSGIEYLESIGEAKWADGIGRELRTLIDDALERKRRTTAGLADVVMLLVDAYHLATAEDWAEVRHDGWGPFHTVARVHGDHECQVLASREPGWIADQSGAQRG